MGRTFREIQMRRLILALAPLAFLVAGGVYAATPAPEGASLYFIAPQDGDTVSSPVTVRFGLSGMGVAPAGGEKDNTGHHQLIIDAPLPEMSEAVPKDENYRHFGGGQTEATIELAPGTHTLQLLLGDWSHIPHDPPVVSEQITITVE